jgi:hypothetical protein
MEIERQLGCIKLKVRTLFISILKNMTGVWILSEELNEDITNKEQVIKGLGCLE